METPKDLLNHPYFWPIVKIIGAVLLVLIIGSLLETKEYKEWDEDPYK